MILQAAKICATIMAVGLPNAEYACKNMQTVVEAATQNDLDPYLLVSLIHEESRWKPYVVSRAGACGLTQLLPKYTKPRHSCKDLKDPNISIWMGAKTLKFWVEKYGRGDVTMGLCGYNAGYRCKGKKALKSGKAYARRIKRRAARLRLQLLKREVDKMIVEFQMRAIEAP